MSPRGAVQVSPGEREPHVPSHNALRPGQTPAPCCFLGLHSRPWRLPFVCSCPNAMMCHQQVSLGNQPQGWPCWAFVTDGCGHPSCLRDGTSPTPTSWICSRGQSSYFQRVLHSSILSAGGLRICPQDIHRGRVTVKGSERGEGTPELELDLSRFTTSRHHL